MRGAAARSHVTGPGVSPEPASAAHDLLAVAQGRHARPGLERARERALLGIAEQQRDFRQRQLGIGEVAARQLEAGIAEYCLVRQSTRLQTAIERTRRLADRKSTRLNSSH